MLVECIYHKRDLNIDIDCLLVTSCFGIVRAVNFYYIYQYLLKSGHLNDIHVVGVWRIKNLNQL